MANYDGLLNTPATDLNFTSGIQRLKDADLTSMLEKLNELNESEGGHKARIKAVEKELKNRNGNSKEILAVEKMQESIEIAEKLYSDGMPYELERVENEIRFFQEQAGTALLEMGKRFIRIKAHEGYGKFIESLNRLGMAPRSAQYAMLAAHKFSNTPTLAHLESSKIKALTVLDDDEIYALKNGGEAAGMTLDDIGRMSVRELREALRTEREKVKKQKATQEKAIKQKEEKLNELEQQLRYQEPLTKEQLARKEIERLNEPYTFALAKINSSIREALNIIVSAERVEAVNVQQLSDWLGQFNMEMQNFHELSRAWTGEIDNAGPIKDWRISDLPA
jgi:hypothetical protein